ncbi:MAG: T9SS type A sorting domain-containing protein, partial [Chitinophagales bacterium]
ITTDTNDEIIFTGYFSNTVDFDPGPGIFNLTTGFSQTIYLAKLSSDGSLDWAKKITGTEATSAEAITTDPNNNILLTGYFYGTCDFDPGPGVSELIAFSADNFIAKYDAFGNYIWAVRFGSEAGGYGMSIVADAALNVYSSGVFWEGYADFDPGTDVFELSAEGWYDFYIQKLSETGCGGMTLVFDSVANATCTSNGYAATSVLYGTAPFEYIWTDAPVVEDSVIVFPVAGTYHITATDANACTKSTALLIEGPVDISEMDMTGNIVYDGFIPGFNSTLWIDVYNNGCVPGSGTVSVMLDPLIHYTGAQPTPDIIAENMLIWNFDDVDYDSIHETFEVYFYTSIDATLDDFIDLQLNVSTPGDDDITNDIKDYHQQVVGAYDPNDKTVFPAGDCDDGFIINTQKLTYTIRFQNTGTAEAVNIKIFDTISTKLNITTLKVVSSSHPMYTEKPDDNSVIFVFNNINLPDSNTNEVESHGYVIFEIFPKTGLADGQTIRNSAAIVFDFNDPIITNKTLNTIRSVIPDYEYEQNVTICEGDSYELGGHSYDSAGVYWDYLIALDGCDSLVRTTIFVNPESESTLNAEICDGENFELGGDIFTDAGSYIVELVNMFGCDSTINLNLIVDPAYDETIATTICNDENYLFNGELLTETGNYTANFSTVLGCDSIFHLDLEVIELDVTVDNSGSTLSANLPGMAYQWINCDEEFSSIDGETNQSFTPETTGNYAVIINDGTCYDTSICYFVNYIGIFDQDLFPPVEIFPNPASEMLTIMIGESSGILKGVIFNSEGGEVIALDDLHPGSTLLNITSLSAGIYMIYFSNKEVGFMKAFVKE